ncbi:energy transducer TonB [Sphingobium sp. AS12]|uniref:energy transducer TonB n=1 Tax=Sphingobium sp. AS12 TaxID=2849495 RepID=UPI001C31A27B|nr:energy transducer TonB [Sphingobium sp. AS12]MBV2148746.1 energy transducer TonB [Sphingobium sp. AS12]
MSIILGALATTALLRASPASYPGTWASDLDYPPEAIRLTKRGTTSFLVLVSPQGKVASCFVTQSSDVPELDKRTCVLLSVRASFKPAADENGQPVYDTYKGSINWRHMDRPNRSLAPKPELDDTDFELQVAKLPNGLQQQRVVVIVRMDTSGRVAYCEHQPQTAVSQQLGAVACAQAKAGYVSITKDAADQPISVIRSLHILFKAAAG